MLKLKLIHVSKRGHRWYKWDNDVSRSIKDVSLSYMKTKVILASYDQNFVKDNGIHNFFHFTDWVGNDYWIGLNDVKTEGDFRWEHDEVSPGFLPWGTGEPNGDTRENCVIVNIYFKWNDIPCSTEHLKRICEFWLNGLRLSTDHPVVL